MSQHRHRSRRPPLAIISSHGESAALHRLDGGSGPMTVLLLHANGFCGLMYEPLVRRSSLSSLATVFALDMPGQGSSPRPRRRGKGSPGALESYSFLALAAVDWLRENEIVSSSSLSLLCAFGHSGGGLAALRAEQQRPGTFRALYLYEPVILTAETAAAATAADPSQERSQREEEASISSPSSALPPPALSSTPSLEAGARRRRRAFSSREAALLSLRRKPPFSLFDAECARIYAEEGMVDEREGEEEGGEAEGAGRRRRAAAAAALPPPTFSYSTTTASAPTAAVSLAASPEDEAAVYLEAGPLGADAGRRLGAVAAPVLVAAGGGVRGGASGAAGGGGGGGGGGAATKGQSSGLLHAPLARAAPRTARLLPRGRLEVYRGLGHLGPFERPEFVGERAAEAFGRAVAVAEGASASWGSLPPERELELLRSGLSAKL